MAMKWTIAKSDRVEVIKNSEGFPDIPWYTILVDGQVRHDGMEDLEQVMQLLVDKIK